MKASLAVLRRNPKNNALVPGEVDQLFALATGIKIRCSRWKELTVRKAQGSLLATHTHKAAF
ncbi:hypothetical protein PsorP6_018282 [Peronosclerospora sorghi]|nr:hypothetical protein PsorP6_018298 [Peronosclerospora sorghi]KAI9895383.1 hypothetical protein PsorP6_018282 [Peronosclerospora sorghi]